MKRIIIGLFAYSGSCGLVYEVVWTRKLTIAFGSTAIGVSITLAAYLAGLAFGAYLFGKLADRFRLQVRAYAFMELAIGCYGLLSLSVLDLGNRLFWVLRSGLSLPDYLLSLLQAIIVLLTLAPSTVLMGGTLPILVAALAEDCRLGSRLGRLYAANTVGAVFGCAATGFVLLPLAGLRLSVWIAAGLNFAVGLAALVVRARAGPRSRSHSNNEVAEAAPMGKRLRPTIGALAVLVSGFSVFFYEVIWTRSLELVLGNSTHSFSVMLVTVLIGLAAGAGTIAWWLRRHASSVICLAVIQSSTAVAVFIATAFVPRTIPWFLAMHSGLNSSGGWLILSELLICGGILLIPSFLLGLSFPLIVDLTLGSSRHEAAGTGRLYALSTIGCILGAFVGGIVLVPLLGLSLCLIFGSCMNLGVAVLLVLDMPFPVMKRAVAAAIPVGLAVVLVAAAPRWDRKTMTSGVFMHAASIRQLGFERYQAQSELLYYREGRNATVDVKRTRTSVVLSIDGRPEGNTHAVAQVLLGHLPFLFGRTLSDVFVVGFGTGNTVGAVTLYPVRQVTVADLEPCVFEASRHFEDINHRPLLDPRVRAVADDARNLLSSSSRPSYDLIISQPSNPWVSGSAKLFTVEFYSEASTRLRPDGIFAQWVQLYNLDLNSVRSLIGTFAQVFPESMAVEVGGNSGEILLFGSRRPLEMSWDGMIEAFSRSDKALDLARVRVSSPAAILARALLGTREMAHVAAGRPNTDDNGLLEFASLHSLYSDTTQANIQYLERNAAMPLDHLSGGPQGLERQRLWMDMAKVARNELNSARALQFEFQATRQGTMEAHGLSGDRRYASSERSQNGQPGTAASIHRTFGANAVEDR